MTIKRPTKMTILPVGSFDPAAPTAADLAKAGPGIEIGEGNFDIDIPLLDLGDGIEAIYIRSARDLHEARKDAWTGGVMRVITYPSGPVFVLGRGLGALAVPIKSYIIKDRAGQFKVLDKETFDGLREVILANAAARELEVPVAE